MPSTLSSLHTHVYIRTLYLFSFVSCGQFFLCYIVVSCADSFVSNLIVREAESVYDYCWYPYMSASGASAALCFLQIHVLDCSTHDFLTKLF